MDEVADIFHVRERRLASKLPIMGNAETLCWSRANSRSGGVHCAPRLDGESRSALGKNRRESSSDRGVREIFEFGTRGSSRATPERFVAPVFDYVTGETMKTQDIDAEREALRKLRDELFSQEPPALADEKLQRRMCDVLVKALNDSQARKFQTG